MLAYRIDGADVVFALAGNVDLAESAWQQCEPALMRHAGKKTTTRQIAASLRSILAKEYRGQVIDCGYVNTQYDYAFIISIRVGRTVELYHTYSKTLKKSRRGREFIGAGGDLAKMLFQWLDYMPLSAERAGEICASFVGTLKRLMLGVVGGNNLIMLLGEDGEIVFYRDADLRLIEQYSPIYEAESSVLLSSFIDGSVKTEEFEKAVERFVGQVRFWRKELKTKRDQIVFSTPPVEAEHAIIDLRKKPPAAWSRATKSSTAHSRSVTLQTDPPPRSGAV
jgi:hypothetical protein